MWRKTKKRKREKGGIVVGRGRERREIRNRGNQRMKNVDIVEKDVNLTEKREGRCRSK